MKRDVRNSFRREAHSTACGRDRQIERGGSETRQLTRMALAVDQYDGDTGEALTKTAIGRHLRLERPNRNRVQGRQFAGFSSAEGTVNAVTRLPHSTERAQRFRQMLGLVVRGQDLLVSAFHHQDTDAAVMNAHLEPRDRLHLEREAHERPNQVAVRND